jgi:hypothetical protein
MDMYDGWRLACSSCLWHAGTMMMPHSHAEVLIINRMHAMLRMLQKKRAAHQCGPGGTRQLLGLSTSLCQPICDALELAGPGPTASKSSPCQELANPGPPVLHGERC